MKKNTKRKKEIILDKIGFIIKNEKVQKVIILKELDGEYLVKDAEFFQRMKKMLDSYPDYDTEHFVVKESELYKTREAVDFVLLENNVKKLWGNITEIQETVKMEIPEVRSSIEFNENSMEVIRQEVKERGIFYSLLLLFMVILWKITIQ